MKFRSGGAMEAHIAARLAVLDALVDAQRRMLRARTAEQVAGAVADLVRRLGGKLVDPSTATAAAIHVDVTFGTASPQVVEVPTGGSAADHLREVLPSVAEDANRAIGRLEGVQRSAPDVGVDAGQPFVIVSELGVAEAGGDTLERAFQDRLGEVDTFDGFLGLQVWRDRRDPQRFVMVGWWRSREDYVAYMRSDAHDRSHDRIPTEPGAPYPVGAGQFDVVTE